MSRKAAFDALSLEEYLEEMKNIFSTCVSQDTLDESPMSYKPMDEIIEPIGPTAEIVDRIRPVYITLRHQNKDHWLCQTRITPTRENQFDCWFLLWVIFILLQDCS